MSFIKKLILEFADNGKLLLGYIINEMPGLTDYPGLLKALQDFAANPTFPNILAVIFQAFLAGAAGHRLMKILHKVLS